MLFNLLVQSVYGLQNQVEGLNLVIRRQLGLPPELGGMYSQLPEPND
jgi:hypothetical protein